MHIGYQTIAQSFPFSEMVLLFLNMLCIWSYFTFGRRTIFFHFQAVAIKYKLKIESNIFCFTLVESTHTTAAPPHMSAIVDLDQWPTSIVIKDRNLEPKIYQSLFI